MLTCIFLQSRRLFSFKPASRSSSSSSNLVAYRERSLVFHRSRVVRVRLVYLSIRYRNLKICLSNSIVEDGCGTIQEVSVNHVVSLESLPNIEDLVRDRGDIIVCDDIEACSLRRRYERPHITPTKLVFPPRPSSLAGPPKQSQQTQLVR